MANSIDEANARTLVLERFANDEATWWVSTVDGVQIARLYFEGTIWTVSYMGNCEQFLTMPEAWAYLKHCEATERHLLWQQCDARGVRP